MPSIQTVEWGGFHSFRQRAPLFPVEGKAWGSSFPLLFLAAQALAHDLRSETLAWDPEWGASGPEVGTWGSFSGKAEQWCESRQLGRHGVVPLTGCGPRQGSNACWWQCFSDQLYSRLRGMCLACRPQHMILQSSQGLIVLRSNPFNKLPFAY